jgi:hypothetical protein
MIGTDKPASDARLLCENGRSAMAACVLEGSDFTVGSATDDDGTAQFFEEFVSSRDRQLTRVPRGDPSSEKDPFQLQCIKVRIAVPLGWKRRDGG